MMTFDCINLKSTPRLTILQFQCRHVAWLDLTFLSLTRPQCRPGLRLKQQKECDLWTCGPKFLLQPIENWENGVSQQPDTDEMEVKAEMVATALRLNTLHLQRDNHVLKSFG